LTIQQLAVSTHGSRGRLAFSQIKVKTWTKTGFNWSITGRLNWGLAFVFNKSDIGGGVGWGAKRSPEVRVIADIAGIRTR
jgi:hypothetical protein